MQVRRYTCADGQWHFEWRSLPLQPMHQSDTASNPARPALLYSGLVAELWPRFCSQLDWGQGCSAATNLEVYRGDHDLLRLLHFWSGGNKWCTDSLGKHNMKKKSQPEKSYQNRYCGIATYITISLQTSGKLIILFISSRRTSRNRC